ncbi:MAG: c-type cytochrome [Thermoplasmata archaeon]
MDRRRRVIGIVVAASLALASQLAWAQVPVPPGLRGDPVKGEQLYRLRGCPTCHGASGKGGNLGPDLTRPWPRREFGWYRSYLTNPRSYLPNSIKPPTIISAEEMEDLVAYLLRLKGLR